MSVFGPREPRRVLYYFEKICSIPHGSGNVKEISDYLVSFARERNLPYRQDENYNVVIWKKGSAGHEDAVPVILQGHMDMVAVKDQGITKDMETEGLDLAIEGDMLYAKGTSLGGDDGIAVAYMLAILEDDSLTHPPIEAVFTSDEEIGLVGAHFLDMSDLSGRILLNLDSEFEGHFIVSSAGLSALDLSFDCDREIRESDGHRLKLRLDGLTGGHSGIEIHLGRLNAITAMGRLLYALSASMDIRLVSMQGGDQDSAIPPWCEAVIALPDCSQDGKPEVRAKALALNLFEVIKKEYIMIEPDMALEISPVYGEESRPMSQKATGTILRTLMILPTGVLRMNPLIKDMTQTSANLGVISTTEKGLIMTYCIRSASETEMQYQMDRIHALVESLSGNVVETQSCPGWEYREESRIRHIMTTVYRRLYGEEPVIRGIHAGLECGIFDSRIPGLDSIAIGPDITGVHTTSEKLDLESARRTYELLVNTLKELVL